MTPTTETGLKEAGYVFEGTGKCRSCKADIAWYRTPAGKMTPLDEGTLVTHWGTCPDAKSFGKKASAPFSDKTDRNQ